MSLPSSSQKHHVFVSHSGEDKHTIAVPLRDMLRERGIAAFVDEKDIPPGGAATAEMTFAMKNADIAVVVLSPEFVAKEWPMKELLFFLHRRQNAQANGEVLPVIIPVFYRLNVADMYKEPDLYRKTEDGRSLYRVTRFYERRDKGEPEADVEIMRRALRALHGIMGVENNYHASNAPSSMPARQLLLKNIYEMVLQQYSTLITRNEETANASGDTEQFCRHFHTEQLRNVVLDFERKDAHGEPLTYEGRIKRRILNRDSNSDQVIAIRGIGGVGKSTILKALVNEKELRETFCDGIYFITLGRDATGRTLVQQLSRVLHDSGAKKRVAELQTERDVVVAIREAVRYALRWFDGRCCLFLIDDVWTTGLKMDVFSHVVKLGCAGLQSSVVLTTRESEIASVAPNQESIFQMAPRLSQATESRDILFLHAGVTEGNTSNVCASDSIMEILEICAGLPVVLAAAGKGVKMMEIDMATHDGDVWKEYLKILHTCHEQLIREDVAEYGNLYITFRTSIALLTRREKEKLGFHSPMGFAEMHQRLCVLPKQVKAPVSILKHLWELKNESEARVVAKRFAEVGLAACEVAAVDGSYEWLLDVHDSIHDFAVSEAEHHIDIAEVHSILLDGYARSHRGRLRELRHGWRRRYMHDNLIYHLRGARRWEEAQRVEDASATPAA